MTKEEKMQLIEEAEQKLWASKGLAYLNRAEELLDTALKETTAKNIARAVVTYKTAIYCMQESGLDEFIQIAKIEEKELKKIARNLIKLPIEETWEGVKDGSQE